MIKRLRILLLFFPLSSAVIAAPVTINFDIKWGGYANPPSGQFSLTYDNALNSNVEYDYVSSIPAFFSQGTEITHVKAPNFPRPDGVAVPEVPDDIQYGPFIASYVVSSNPNPPGNSTTFLNLLLPQGYLLYFNPDADAGNEVMRSVTFELKLYQYQLPSPLNIRMGKPLLDRALVAAWRDGATFGLRLGYGDVGVGGALITENNFEGSATISSIVTTPIPGAAYLLGSALLVLSGFNKRRIH